jgi:hypothetical protein
MVGGGGLEPSRLRVNGLSSGAKARLLRGSMWRLKPPPPKGDEPRNEPKRDSSLRDPPHTNRAEETAGSVRSE